jgi:exopolysaccharide biosynthesis polyprenyl glycosylphosphotransferase
VSRPLRSSERRVALLAGDGLAVTIAVLLALWTWSITAGFPFEPGFVRLHLLWLVAVPLWLLLLLPSRDASVALDLRQTAVGIGRAAGALLVVYLGLFFFAGDRLPRLVALYIFWDATLLVLGWRIVALWFLTRAPFSRRILIAGSGEALATTFAVLADSSFRDAAIVGVATTDSPGADWPAPVVGSPAEIDDVAHRVDATDLVVALDGRAADIDDKWVQRLLHCQERGTNVIRVGQLYEETFNRVPVEHLESSWLLTNFFDVARFRDASPIAKRLFDLVMASLLACVGIVVAPVVALAVLIDSGAPVLYRQQRVGRGGRPFWLTKFRSMSPDAESDGQPRWSTPGDARVTPLGRLLRRTRLDELPNVLSVLRGEMSMVGPRPERPEFVDHLEGAIPFSRARLIVRPGLTGWAQVNWPYGDSIRDATVKLEYDLYYIKHQSIWFDAFILLRTVGTMLRMRGR